MKEKLAPKELTPQELEQHIQELFVGYAYRKMSYHMERKEIFLLFDYPDSLDSRKFQEKAVQFQKITGWTCFQRLWKNSGRKQGTGVRS